MKNLLNEAKQEILTLRRRNELLEARMEVVNIFAVALGMKQAPQGYSPDVVHKIQQRIDALDTMDSEPE